MNTKTETIKAIEENRLFDFIASHYSEMSKDELVTIAKELAYVIDSFKDYSYAKEMTRYLKDELIGELEDQLSDEEE